MVVVTRWYGGIKLGAGGLVRAYGGAAAECLRTAPRQPLVAMREVTVRCGFEDIGSVHVALAASGAEKRDEAFDADGVRLQVVLPATRLAALQAQLRDATRDRAQVQID
jgi:putative IMPACT (imprinted ancient) family translation regulator